MKNSSRVFETGSVGLVETQLFFFFFFFFFFTHYAAMLFFFYSDASIAVCHRYVSCVSGSEGSAESSDYFRNGVNRRRCYVVVFIVSVVLLLAAAVGVGLYFAGESVTNSLNVHLLF